MGSKFSKAGGDVNVKSVIENEESSNKLNEIRPALSSGKSVDISKHETQTLPRHFERSRSASKRFRRSCRNWAVGKGFIAEKKSEEVIEKEKQEGNADIRSVATDDVILIDLEADPEVNLKNTKEADIGTIVADMVFEANKRKTLSKLQSRETLCNYDSTENSNVEMVYKFDNETLVTFNEPKVIHEIQVTLEEDTVEITTPSILRIEKTEEVSEVTENAAPLDASTEHVEENNKDEAEIGIKRNQDIDICNKATSELYTDNNFQETSFDEIYTPEIKDIQIASDGGFDEASFYFDIKVNEEFVISARYENDVFEEATTESLVTITNMPDLNKNGFTDSFKPRNHEFNDIQEHCRDTETKIALSLEIYEKSGETSTDETATENILMKGQSEHSTTVNTKILSNENDSDKYIICDLPHSTRELSLDIKQMIESQDDEDDSEAESVSLYKEGEVVDEYSDTKEEESKSIRMCDLPDSSTELSLDIKYMIASQDDQDDSEAETASLYKEGEVVDEYSDTKEEENKSIRICDLPDSTPELSLDIKHMIASQDDQDDSEVESISLYKEGEVVNEYLDTKENDSDKSIRICELPDYERVLSLNIKHMIESQDSEDDSEVESVSSYTEEEYDSFVKSSEKISAMDFLLDDDDQDYLEEFFPVGSVVQEKGGKYEELFSLETSFLTQNNDIENNFSSLRLKNVGLANFGFLFNTSQQLNNGIREGSISARDESSLNSSLSQQYIEDGENFPFMETTNKDVLQQNDFNEKLYQINCFEDPIDHCKVNPLFIEDYELEESTGNKNSNANDDLIQADDILKEFFEQFNETFLHNVPNEEAKVTAENSFENNNMLDFYLNDQMISLNNDLEFNEDIRKNNSNVCNITDLESIEEENEEEFENEDFDNGNIESPYQPSMETITVNNDSNNDPHNYIKTAICEMFPIHNFVLDTNHEQSCGATGNIELYNEHCNTDGIGSLVDQEHQKCGSVDVNAKVIDNKFIKIKEIPDITLNKNENLTDTKHLIECQEYDDVSEADSFSSLSDVESDSIDSYIEANNKISAMNFLLEESLDYLDNMEFFPTEFDKDENAMKATELNIFQRKNRMVISHNFAIVSNHNFGNHWNENSESSPEPQPSEHIKSAENTKDDCHAVEDAKSYKHEFMREILGSLLNQITSKNDLQIESNDFQSDIKDNLFALDNDTAKYNEDEHHCESPLDDFHSDAGSENGTSTDEGIVATSDDNNDIEKDLTKARITNRCEDKDRNEMFYHCLEHF